MKLSPQERQRRSDLAKDLIRRQTGFGTSEAARKGAAASARTRRARSSAALAQSMFERHADEVRRALLDVLRNGSPSQRIRAAETLVKAGLAGQRVESSEEENSHRQMSRDELLAKLSTALTSGPTAGLLRQQLEAPEVVDAELVEEG